MGQHKYNPKAIAAKNGELPPKPKKQTKREKDEYLRRLVLAGLLEHGIPVSVLDMSNKWG